MSEPQAGTAVAGQGPSAGALLRQAREASGLHLAALAVALKVPPRKLEALEQDRHDLLPDAVFARALAASVCRTLKIDPQPIMERLPQVGAPRLVQDSDGINAPFRAPGDATAAAWQDRLRQPPVLVAGLLVLGALALLVWPLLPHAPASAPTVATASTGAAPGNGAGGVALGGGSAAVAEPAAAPAPASPPALSPTPAPAAQPAVLSAGNAPAVVPVTPGAPVPPVAQPAPAAPGAPASAAAHVATDGIVVFRTSGPSWVQVTDAAGNVTLRRLMAAGETAGASGATPLAVTVGSAGSTTVTVRGRAFDLAPVSRDNVARFEVK